MSTQNNGVPPDLDEVIFAAEDPGGPADAPVPGWKLLIADDDEEVHALTRLVLSGFTFEGRSLSFVSAFSGRETVDRMREHPDTALVLLDVVMECDDAGLQAVRRIRDELGNRFVRIILRTGQPGQAPEQEVVSSYDINDYKAKTELTAQKLFTAVTAALRAYRDVRTIERHRVGFELISRLTGRLFEHADPAGFRRGALRRFAEIVAAAGVEEGGISGFSTVSIDRKCLILEGAGIYSGLQGRAVAEVCSDEVRRRLAAGRTGEADVFGDDWYEGHFATAHEAFSNIYLETAAALPDLARSLVRSYAANVRVALQNLHLNLEVVESQREMIHTLGEVVESRSQETAHHVKRVASHSYRLARLAGIDEERAQLLQMAAPLHDVGKIAIPDAILNKPGRLTDEERRLMMTHAELGHQILSSSNRDVFQTAALVALQHHEKWDGTGYPRGLRGEEIDIFGRIVGLVDVFDALSHERAYKPAFPLEKCVEILKQDSGRHFDPRLVELFLANLSEFAVADGPRGAVPSMEEAVGDLLAV
ncbi:MAG: DUF3369 domain-containing protein [Desulfobacterales bacterium]|nr:DUF3369 domain-containing protein [Desulfobacterales bacterium]